jgi:hypothetical protein
VRRSAALAALLTVAAAVAGCADINPPAPGRQAAAFGVLVTWDTTQAGNTMVAQDALLAKCGLPAPRSSIGNASSYVSVPDGTYTDTEATCLGAANIVKNVDILNGPAPSSS